MLLITCESVLCKYKIVIKMYQLQCQQTAKIILQKIMSENKVFYSSCHICFSVQYHVCFRQQIVDAFHRQNVCHHSFSVCRRHGVDMHCCGLLQKEQIVVCSVVRSYLVDCYVEMLHLLVWDAGLKVSVSVKCQVL